MQEQHLHACWSLLDGWMDGSGGLSRRGRTSPFRVTQLLAPSSSSSPSEQQTLGLVIPHVGLQYRELFLFWDFDGESGRRCLLICPHMDAVWLRCWGLLLQLCIVETRSQPDLSWVSSHSPFFLFYCKYLAVCLWILICCMTKICFTQSQFFSVIFLHSFKLTQSLISVSYKMNEMMWGLHRFYFTCEIWNGSNSASGGGNWT